MVYCALYLITFSVTLVLSQQDRPCLKHLAENITDGKHLRSGVILKNNITYDSGNYYIEDGSFWGCTCNIHNCIQMCCDVNEFFINKTCQKSNSYSELNISIFEGTNKLSNLSVREFSFIKSLECPENYLRVPAEETDLIYIQKNGSLFFVSGDYEAIYEIGHYCLVKKKDNTQLNILCEFVDKTQEELMKMYSKGMIISMPFLLATFLVYAILPESNLHRKALMNYVLTLLLAYIFLVVVQLYPSKFDEKVICPLLGYLIIFFFLLSFFWMNVICLDMWFAFSGMKGFNGRRFAEKKRFIMYSIYAVGVPLLHTLIVFLINTYGDKNAYYFPGVGYEKCFLRDTYPNLFYFYGPMAILITINCTLFVLTAVKIQKVKRETSMLKQSDSKRHSYEDDKQKFNLYVKLLFAMGINWTMEVISWAIEWRMTTVPQYVWYLTDFCNAMYGVFIFFIFVFKKKIWRSLKKRYYVFIGKPHYAHSMSVTQTTRSSNYSTTDTGLNDHRLSELKNGRGEDRILPQN